MVALIVWINWSPWNVDLGPFPGGYHLDAWRGFRLLWMARPDALRFGVLLAVFNARLPDPLSAAGACGSSCWVGHRRAILASLS